ncbi:MAG TPA: MASE3 domain-containing protein [Bacteroidota bacterium]|nr:MASE3 domain-containing protein [Bacteroidota bacterium]
MKESATLDVSQVIEEKTPGSERAVDRISSLPGISHTEWLLFLLFLFGVHLTAGYNYLLFHSIAELFSIAISATIFLLVINGWPWITNQYVRFIGVSSGFIAILDTLHTLSFRGIPIFTDYDYYAPQLWVASRYVESASMVLAFAFLGMNRRIRLPLALCGFALVTGWLVASILYLKDFPVCFVIGKGLTAFKIISEYVICGLFGLALALLHWNRKFFEHTIYHQLQLAIIVMIGMELSFTLFVSDTMSDFFNQVGHLLKICAFFIIYKTVVVTALRNPISVLARELRATEEKLSAQRLLDSVIDNMPNMLFLKRASDLRFMLFNRAGEQLTGYSRNELLGKNDYDFFPREQADFFAAKDQEVLTSSGFLDIPEEAIDTRQAERRFLHTKKVALYDSDGKPEYLLGIAEDITDAKLKAEELRSAEEEVRLLNADLERRVEARTAELEAANRELEAFSFSVSHDLRAPLRAIDGFAKIMAEDFHDRLDAGGLKHLTSIRRSAGRMEQLIDDLLEFSRSARREMNAQSVDMEGLAREIIQELRTAVPDRKMTFNVAQLPEARGDRAMLREVLMNLLSNAIKFTAGLNEAIIEIGGSIDGANTNYYIKDNGAGFDMQYKDKLFGVFERLHSAQEFEGTGIGLAIVKRIVDRHSGKVWAEGKVDKGATIGFSLPV